MNDLGIVSTRLPDAAPLDATPRVLTAAELIDAAVAQGRTTRVGPRTDAGLGVRLRKSADAAGPGPRSSGPPGPGRWSVPGLASGPE